jgi:hypothetical protein
VTVHELKSAEWSPALDALSRALVGYRAEIEIGSLDLGDQMLAEWVPLIGVTYDRKSDAVEVALDGLDHLIFHPREIYFDTDGEGLLAVTIVNGDGEKQIVRFREPLSLPLPG